MNSLDRTIAVIGYPLDTVAASLERGGMDEAAFNVSFAYDHEEAAGFVADALDELDVSEWTSSAVEWEFVRSFARIFAGA